MTGVYATRKLNLAVQKRSISLLARLAVNLLLFLTVTMFAVSIDLKNRCVLYATALQSCVIVTLVSLREKSVYQHSLCLETRRNSRPLLELDPFPHSSVMFRREVVLKIGGTEQMLRNRLTLIFILTCW